MSGVHVVRRASWLTFLSTILYTKFSSKENEKTKPAAGHKQNLVDKAVQYLTREILADRLRPNQRISEVAVCEQLGISRSPVREALRMLERDGLVKQSGKRGVVVADITPEEADELYLVHGHLIGLAGPARVPPDERRSA